MSFCTSWTLSSFEFNPFLLSQSFIDLKFVLFCTQFRDAFHQFNICKFVQTFQVQLQALHDQLLACLSSLPKFPFQPTNKNIFSSQRIPSSITFSPFQILMPLPRVHYPQEKSHSLVRRVAMATMYIGPITCSQKFLFILF